MDIVNKITAILLGLLGFFCFYKTIFIIIGFFLKSKKYPDTEQALNYAFVIAAKNEEKVIGKLIESIRNQDYDQSKITIFVVADNCSDSTSQICKDLGCVVYERINEKLKRKGYALEYLFERIEEDYKIDSFDGYVVFDADNILEEDFMTQMNKAFVVNKNVVTGYRNSKNFGTNFITASYSIHFFNSMMTMHRPRGIFNLGTHLSGTGYVIASHLLKDGWKWHSLTEDTELTAELTIKNIKIGYCEEAVFYDEHPTNFLVSCRQRIRWTKGRLVVFARYWFKLLKSIFTNKSFTSYDIFWYIFPYTVASTILTIAYPLCSTMISLFITKDFVLSVILWAIAGYFGLQYLGNLFSGTLSVIRECKHIHCSKIKTFFYLLVWPWFYIFDLFIVFIALFKRNVKWVAVKHSDESNLDDIVRESLIKTK